MNKEKKVYYYKDELEVDFATMENIKIVNVDENYKFIHKNPIWNIASILIQNVLSMPIKYLYAKLKFNIRFIGKEKLKKSKKKRIFYICKSYSNICRYFYPKFSKLP